MNKEAIHSTKNDIWATVNEIAEMLVSKNEAYGDSALSPVRIFSKADATEQIRVRIDDKLSRLVSGKDAGEGVELDLIGYLILLRIARKRAGKSEGKSLPTIHKDDWGGAMVAAVKATWPKVEAVNKMANDTLYGSDADKRKAEAADKATNKTLAEAKLKKNLYVEQVPPEPPENAT